MLGDKIFYCVIRKELFKFPIQLRRQSLIMRNDQRWFIQLLYDIRHRKCLTGSGNSKQRLTLVSFFETTNQLLNRLRLISDRLIF